MKPETALFWWHLNLLPSRKRYDFLTERFGDMEAATKAFGHALLREMGCREETAAEVLRASRTFDAAALRRDMESRGVSLVTIEDDGYPPVLKTIEDAPVFLSCRGDMMLLRQPLIALVGTRDMSPYGKRVAGMLVPELVRSGAVTVSGLALGIDAEVARETMRSGGKTVAVLGGGLASVYPTSNETLAEEIVAKGGLLLSEFPLHKSPERFTFPSRNRIIAGLGLGTVVVEAAEKSGAIITAELALDYNRSVFAAPGSVFDPRCSGCHSLIARGEAKLVSSARDILMEVGIVASERTEPISFDSSSPEEKAVWDALTAMPRSMDDLIGQTGMAPGVIFATLTVLELQGVAVNLGGGQWVRA